MSLLRTLRDMSREAVSPSWWTAAVTIGTLGLLVSLAVHFYATYIY